MKIQVISKSKKKGIDTAQIVVKGDGKSKTHHVWGNHSSGQYVNVWGAKFELNK